MIIFWFCLNYDTYFMRLWIKFSHYFYFIYQKVEESFERKFPSNFGEFYFKNMNFYEDENFPPIFIFH